MCWDRSISEHPDYQFPKSYTEMAMTLRSQHTVLLSGFSEADRARLGSMITKLGGCYLESQMFSHACTHLICGRMSRSEKFLGACATGCWILVPSYIECCHAADSWLPEEKFEWGPHWKHLTDDKCSDDLLLAPHRWRTCLSETTAGSSMAKGAFDKWRVGLVVDNTKRRKVYKRLLEVGGAAFVKLKLDGGNDLTHVFVDQNWLDSLQQKLLNTDVLCSTPSYIGDYLLKTDTPVCETSRVSNANSSILQSFISSPSTVNNHIASANSSFTGSPGMPGKMSRHHPHRNVTPPHRIIYSPAMTSLPTSAAVTPVKLSQSSTSSMTSNDSNKSRRKQTMLKDFFSSGKFSAAGRNNMTSNKTPNGICIQGQSLINVEPGIDVTRKSKNALCNSQVMCQSTVSTCSRNFHRAKFSPRVTRSKTSRRTSPCESSKQMPNVNLSTCFDLSDNTPVVIKNNKLIKSITIALSEFSKRMSSDKIATCVDLTADTPVYVGDNKVSRSKATAQSKQSKSSMPILSNKMPTCVALTADTPVNVRDNTVSKSKTTAQSKQSESSKRMSSDKIPTCVDLTTDTLVSDNRTRFISVKLTNNTPVTGSPFANKLIRVKSVEKESQVMNNGRCRLLNCMNMNLDRSPQEIRNLKVSNEIVRKLSDNEMIIPPPDPDLVMSYSDEIMTVKHPITRLLQIRNDKTRKIYDPVRAQQNLIPCSNMNVIQYEFQQDCIDDDINIELAKDDLYIYKKLVVTIKKQNNVDNLRTESPLLMKESNDPNLEKHSHIKSSRNTSAEMCMTSAKRNRDSSQKTNIAEYASTEKTIMNPGIVTPTNVKRNVFVMSASDSKSQVNTISSMTSNGANVRNTSSSHESTTPGSLPVENVPVKRKIFPDSLDQAAARVTKRMKVNHEPYGIIDCSMGLSKLSKDSLSRRSESDAPVLPMSHTVSSLIDSCMEENYSASVTIDVIYQLSQTNYLESDILHKIMTKLLLEAQDESDAQSAERLLQSILLLHPPTFPAIQTAYLHSLRKPRDLTSHKDTFIFASQCQEWPFIKSVLDACIIDESADNDHDITLKQGNSLKLFAFIVKLLEIDFFCHLRSATSEVNMRKTILGQILWPINQVAYMQKLVHHVLDTLLAVNKQTFQLTTLLLKLLALIAEFLKWADNSYIALPTDVIYGSRVTSLIYELARRVTRIVASDVGFELNYLLSMIKPCWLALGVCDVLLNNMDNSLVTERIFTGISMEKIVKVEMFKLPELVEMKEINTPSTKKWHSKTRYENSKDLLASPHSDRKMKKLAASVNRRNSKGETELHLACMKNNINHVRDLLAVPGIAVNTKDYAGWTALHEASNKGHVECVRELLLFKPAKTIQNYFSMGCGQASERLELLTSNDEGITALHDAVQNNRVEVAELLCQYGGVRLLEAKTVTNIKAIDLVTSESMRTALSLDSTPLKGLPNFMNFSQESSSSSQGSPQPDLLPCEELYKQVLGGASGSMFASVDSCLRYMSLIRRTLQLYIETNHLDAASNNDGDSDPVDDDDGKENVSVSERITETVKIKQSTVKPSVLSDWNDHRCSSRTCRSVWRKSSDDVTVTDQLEETLLSGSASLQTRNITDKLCKQRLMQDLVIYLRLHKYVQIFAEHIRRISQEQDKQTLLYHLEHLTLLCPTR